MNQKSQAQDPTQPPHNSTLTGVPVPAAVPTSIDGFELLDPIGRGGMSQVYRARQINLNRIVALKFLNDIRPEMSKRLLVEGQAIAKLQHPNIAQIYEIGQSNQTPYLALEYLGGGTLRHRIESPWSPRQAVELVATLAEATEHSHQNGVIHRDLKPGNILFDQQDNPKIVDFGLAKFIDHDDALTKTGSVLGTPAYMAPEQASGVVKNIGAACDVYALGGILYELLVGRPPFWSDDYAQTLMMVLSTEPVSPRRLQPSTPRDLETICLRCLEKRASRRYATSGELASDLRRFLADKPIRARRISRLERLNRLARRKPVATSLIAISTLLLCALIVGGLIYNTRLKNANSNITKQRDRSERLFSSGKSLARWVLFEHAQKIKSIAGTEAERELTERLKDYLDELQAHVGDDADLSNELASAYEQLARIQGDPYSQNLGRNRQALQSYETAFRLRQELAEQFPEMPLVQLDLANSFSNLGAVRFILGQSSAAMEAYQNSLKILTKIDAPSENVSDALIARTTAATWMRMGDVQQQLGQLNAADESYAKSANAILGLQTESANALPRPSLEALTVVESRQVQLAIRQTKLGQRPMTPTLTQRFRAFQNSLQQLEEFVEQDPTLRFELAQSIRITAEFQRSKGKLEEALELNEKVLKLFREMAAKDPQNVSLAREVCLCLSQIGEHYHEAEQYELAETYYRESASKTELLVRRQPENIDLRNDRWVNCFDLGTNFMFQKKYDEASSAFQSGLTLARQWLELGDPNHDDLLRVAQSYERLGTLQTLQGNASETERTKIERFQTALLNFRQSLKSFASAARLDKESPTQREQRETVSSMIQRLEEFLIKHDPNRK